MRELADHGTRSRYVNGPCRCEPCTEANRAYIAAWRATLTPATAAVHGTDSTYVNHGCRCRSCTAAHAATKRRERAA